MVRLDESGEVEKIGLNLSIYSQLLNLSKVSPNVMVRLGMAMMSCM